MQAEKKIKVKTYYNFEKNYNTIITFIFYILCLEKSIMIKWEVSKIRPED
jgi:hypothetical protein